MRRVLALGVISLAFAAVPACSTSSSAPGEADARFDLDSGVEFESGADARCIEVPHRSPNVCLRLAGLSERGGAHRCREDLKKHPLIGFVDELLFPPEVRFSDAIGVEPRIRSTNVLAQLHATLSGSGLCRAACFHRIQQPDARSGAAGPSVAYALLSPAHSRRS